MVVLSVILIILFVLIAIFMSFFVLVQDEQGDSIGGLFGGGSSASPFGASSNSMMIRITAILGALFLGLSLGVAFILKTPSSDSVNEAARRQQNQNALGDWFAPKDMAPDQGNELVIPEE